MGRLCYDGNVITWSMGNFRGALTIISLLLVGLSFYLVLSNFEGLPERIPSHFGSSGQPDKYSGRSSIWTIPIVSLIIFLILLVISNIPSSFNYPVKITPANENRQKENLLLLICLIQFEVALLNFFTVNDQLKVALGLRSQLSSAFLIMISLVLITIAVMLHRSVRLR